ncbi:MAG: protein kinase [Pirellula sp.]
MTSIPTDPNSSTPDGQLSEEIEIDRTSGFDSLPNADETSAFDSKTKSSKSGDGSKNKSPRKVGGYALGDLLGQGGMGRVFRADDSTGRSVALKLLSPDLARSPEALARFKQEGLIASQINHPHCVFVHRVDDDSGTPFIAMELMTGKTLKDIVQERGPLNCQDAIRLILQCIDGLIEAHSLGMIHRDIKPANCYLDDDGNVKIGDFGLARSLISDSDLTQTGAFLGTPLFASPEQLLGQSIDARSDIYSLTATLYYLLAGKAPFESPHAAQVIARIASSDPPSFKSAGVEVPPNVEQIVMKGLSREASKRYASFVQMRNDLQATIEPKMEPATLIRRSIAWIADYSLLTSLIAVLLLAFFPPKQLETKPIWANVIAAIFVFCYYLLSEYFFGTSMGKAAMRISVVDHKTGARPSFLRVLGRVMGYVTVSSLLFIAIKFSFRVSHPGWEGILAIIAFSLNVLLLYSTWRATGKRQLFHDWISGTECRARLGQRTAVKSQLQLPEWSLPTSPGHTGQHPSMLGRFAITGVIQTSNATAQAEWLAGRDLQLERTIWIACLKDKSIEFEEIQKQKPKSTRLRFIEEGAEPQCRWFAYAAPEGIPLGKCTSNGVQFPWPVTRSILGEIASASESGVSDSTWFRAGSCRTWIDQSGRLAFVDFDHAEGLGTQPNDARQKGNGSSLGLIQQVAKLGLPASHRFRRKDEQSTFRAPAPDLDGLPPLRATTLLESIVATKYAPTPTGLLQDLDKIDKKSHEVSGSIRFLASVISIGLMSPFFFFAMIMLVIPSVMLITDGLSREVRMLKSLAAFSEYPDQYVANWELVNVEERKKWLDIDRKSEIAGALATQSERLKTAIDRVGAFEQFILKSIPSRVKSLENPAIYGVNPQAEKLKSNSDEQDEKGSRLKFNAGPMNIVEVNFGNEKIDEALMRAILQSVDRSRDSPSSQREFPDALIVGIGLLVCIVWTTLTLGGVTQYFVGTCVVKRDGRRLGFLRSFWRSSILYAPLLLVAMTVAYCNWRGFDFLWWGTQVKRMFCMIPIAFLATTLLWPRRTPLDVLSGTAVVPR